MRVGIVGINHKLADLKLREQLAKACQKWFCALQAVHEKHYFVLLSTCNRTEIYAHVLNSHNYFEEFIQLISRIKELHFQPTFKKYFYILTHREATRHLLRVVTGLDSLVLGEKQILGQVKEAFEHAQQKFLLSRDFNILANFTIRAGKKAQSETEIGYGGSSISWAALVMAEKLLGSLKERSVLLIGAGEMGELVVDQVVNRGIKTLYLMNRTEERAKTLAAKYQAIPTSFCDIKEVLSAIDVCICSAGAPHYILEKSTVEKVVKLRDQSRLILIDISMPRNIDPAVATLEHVVLSHLDDLTVVVEETMRKRESAVGLVEDIIEKKLKDFYSKLEKISESPTVLSTPP